MSEVKNKAAYLRGFADGLKWDRQLPYEEMLDAIMRMLDEAVEKIDEIEARIEFLESGESGVRFAEDMFDDNDEFEVACSNCKERVIAAFDMLSDEDTIICPVCQHEIQVECDCDCGC